MAKQNEGISGNLFVKFYDKKFPCKLIVDTQKRSVYVLQIGDDLVIPLTGDSTFGKKTMIATSNFRTSKKNKQLQLYNTERK